VLRRTVERVEREPVLLTRGEAWRIIAAGATAGRDPDTLVLACPYSPTGDAAERVRVAAWVRGWVEARRRLLGVSTLVS
jgi:hypothetical protein